MGATPNDLPRGISRDHLPTPHDGDIVFAVMDPILLFLGLDVVGLLLLAARPAVVPLAVRSLLASALCGLGTLFCLGPLLFRLPERLLVVPAGPPGLSLHFALDPLSMSFLTIVFLAGSMLTLAAQGLAFQPAAMPPESAVPPTPIQRIACCVAGAAIALLAADAVGLTLGLATMCAATWHRQHKAGGHIDWEHRDGGSGDGGLNIGQPGRWTSRLLVPAGLLVPLLLLAALCLLTPAGFAPRFDTIRAAPVNPDRAAAAAVLTVAAIVVLAFGRGTERCWTRDALTAGVVVPAASYLLLRTLADLASSAATGWWGLVLLMAGAAIAVIEGWRAAAAAAIDSAAACLVRRQLGLAMAGVGLALVAGEADLPGSASFALAATLLSAIGGSLAGILTTLAAHALGASAGSFRLSRLGGLVQTMPVTSATIAAGLLGLAAVPPGVGFASMWLLFSAILSAPRGGGLLAQLPVVLTAAAIAISAALAAAASVRLVGVALLGRPRTPRGSSAREVPARVRTVLLVLSGLSLLAGILPGPALWLLAKPVIDVFTGGAPDGHNALALLWNAPAAPGYLALPVLALLAMATAAVLLTARWPHKDAKPAGLWTDGMPPPAGLPFGQPDAQSAGEGFLPELPGLPKLGSLLMLRFRMPRVPRPPSPVTGLWLIVGAFGALLLALAVTG